MWSLLVTFSARCIGFFSYLPPLLIKALLLYIPPAHFEGKINRWKKDRRSAPECRRECHDYRRRFKLVRDFGGTLLALSVGFLQVISGPSSSASVVACTMCTIICSLITCFFGFFYLWILGITLTTSGEADLWVRNLQCGSPGRPSWRDHSLTLAAPFSWLGWTAISLITLVIAIVVDIDNLSSNTSNKFSRPALISIIVFLILLLLGGLVHLTICIMNLRQLVAHTHRNSSFLPM